MHMPAAELSNPPHGKSVVLKGQQSSEAGSVVLSTPQVYVGGPRVTDPALFAVGSQGAASVRVAVYNDQLRILCNVS